MNYKAMMAISLLCVVTAFPAYLQASELNRIRDAIQNQKKLQESIELNAVYSIQVDEKGNTGLVLDMCVLSQGNDIYFSIYKSEKDAYQEIVAVHNGERTIYSPDGMMATVDKESFSFARSWDLPIPSMARVWDGYLFERITKDQLGLDGKTQVVDGIECRVLTGKNGNLVYTVYVSEKLGYMPVLIEEFAPSKNTVIARKRFEGYSELKPGLFYPNKIIIEAFDQNSKFLIRNTSEIKDIKINEPISDSRFQIAFPDGAQIYDGEKRYEIKEGEKMPIFPKEPRQ